MRTTLLVLVSILPVLVLLRYFDKQDRGKKEPLRLKWKVFKWGILATIIAGIIEINLDSIMLSISENKLIYGFLTAFVTAAIVEEGLKMWVVRREVYKDKDFDEVMDGISYTVIASMGFALLENILYVVEGGLAVGIIRALISVPAHAMFSGIMGFYIGKARFAPMSWQGSKLLWKGFAIAVFYHGLFNFLLFTESPLMFLVIPLLITMAVHLHQKIKQARYEDKVDRRPPANVSIWTIVKIFFASMLIVLGTGSFIGSIVLAGDARYDYGKDDIISSAIFAVVLYIIGYFIIRRKKDRSRS